MTKMYVFTRIMNWTMHLKQSNYVIRLSLYGAWIKLVIIERVAWIVVLSVYVLNTTAKFLTGSCTHTLSCNNHLQNVTDKDVSKAYRTVQRSSAFMSEYISQSHRYSFTQNVLIPEY